MLKAIADKNRVKLPMHCVEMTRTVCDICKYYRCYGLQMPLITCERSISKGVVKFRKEGELAFYSLDDEHIRQIMMIALALKKRVKINV